MSRFFRQAGDSDSESESSDEESLRSDDEAPAKPVLAPGQKPMSRFLRTEGPDSDSSSEQSDNDDDDSDSDGDGAAEGAAPKLSKFKKGAADSGSDSDGPRGKVRPARDKRLEEMEGTSKSIDNAVKINDWVAISTGESSSYSRSPSQYGPLITFWRRRIRETPPSYTTTYECWRICASSLFACSHQFG